MLGRRILLCRKRIDLAAEWRSFDVRFAIYGAGGVGGTIGARLFQHGEDVTLIARGSHLDALQRNGLRFRSPDEDVRLRIPVVGHPSALTRSDDLVVVLCMKSQHTVAALDELRRACGIGVTVVCCQNGVANEREASRRFASVYAMVVMLPALHLEPGEVVSYGTGVSGILDVGRFPSGVDDCAREIAARFKRSGFASEPDANVMRQKYAKLLMNLNNALQAATVMGEGTEPISRALREEAIACYRAAGIDFADVDEVRAKRRNGPRSAEVKGVARGGGSSWQSIARGTGDIESDYLNGEIVLLGRLHGVPTPVNAVVQQLAQEIVARRLPVASFTLAEIQERLGSAL
jgi:2-dehydropantoate 2-reductase